MKTRLAINSTAGASASSETSNQKKPRTTALANVLFQNPEHHPFLAYLYTREYELVPLSTGQLFGQVPIIDVGIVVADRFQFFAEEAAYDGIRSIVSPAYGQPELWREEDEAALQWFWASERDDLRELREYDNELADNYEIALKSIHQVFDARRPVLEAIRRHPNAGRRLSKGFVVRDIRPARLVDATAGAGDEGTPFSHARGSDATRRKRKAQTP